MNEGSDRLSEIEAQMNALTACLNRHILMLKADLLLSSEATVATITEASLKLAALAENIRRLRVCARPGAAVGLLNGSGGFTANRPALNSCAPSDI